MMRAWNPARNNAMHRAGLEKVGPEKLTAAKSEDAASDVASQNTWITHIQ